MTTELEEGVINMKVLGFKPTGELFTSVAIGAAVVAVPTIAPYAWSAIRPLLKSVLKGGYMLYETGREAYDSVSESTRSGGPAAAKPVSSKEHVAAKTPKKRSGARFTVVEEPARAPNIKSKPVPVVKPEVK